MSDTIPLAYDLELKKVGCVLIQAAMGGCSVTAQKFNSRNWLTAPSPGMKVYMLPADKLEQLIRMTDGESGT